MEKTKKELDELKDKWFEDYFNKEAEREELIKKLKFDTSYIEWLKQYTQDNESFSDIELHYSSEGISKFDRENIEKLNLFFDLIRDYAQHNYIYPVHSISGDYYRVKYNDFAFVIGCQTRLEIVYFINKVSIKEAKNFIDFNDIMTDKRQDNVEQIKGKLNSLSKLIIEAYESGIPIEAITNTFKTTITNIENNKEGAKVLVKNK